MAALDPETAELDAAPPNWQVLAWLRVGAEPARSEYRLGGYEQHVHPDVCERLGQVARGGRSVAAYGHCARVARAGVLYAIGMGTGSIALRLPDGLVREAVLAHDGRLDTGLGPEWVVADAWLSEVPRAEGTSLLEEWVEAARLAADA
jgi:hypothetical protein